jgi:hypothetical protein
VPARPLRLNPSTRENGNGSPAGRFARFIEALAARQREGESLTDALLRTRQEIAVAQGELQRARAAPPAAGEINAALAAGDRRPEASSWALLHRRGGGGGGGRVASFPGLPCRGASAPI